jgi:ABC-type antimicrobial peptide transport system permease subunit
MALVMAAAGLYGVKAYLVAQRTREIGIRIAIGARPRQVIAMVLREGAWMVVGAMVFGVALALALGQFVRQMLIGVNPFDPLVVSVAALALTVSILAACYVPARRATRITPTEALRLE